MGPISKSRTWWPGLSEWFALAPADGGGGRLGIVPVYIFHCEQRKPAPTSYSHLWVEWRVRRTKDMNK